MLWELGVTGIEPEEDFSSGEESEEETDVEEKEGVYLGYIPAHVEAKSEYYETFSKGINGMVDFVEAFEPNMKADYARATQVIEKREEKALSDYWKR